MKSYTYQNTLVSKKQLKQLLSWSFNKYGSIKACFLADELKYLGFKYATQAGISISIEDLRVPAIKNEMLKNANNEILNAEKICLKGKITDVERYQKIIDTWNITSELLKDEVVTYFKKFDPLNPVYIMAFSGARGNLSQVRQLVGMRGLMSDPSGQIMNLPIKKNFREGLTITDYLMSGYGARKGIVDTALKTANSGYLTRRLIDVAQDIIIREKDCLTTHSFLFINNNKNFPAIPEKILGRLLNKAIWDPYTNELIGEINTQITPNFIRLIRQRNIKRLYIRSPLTCCLYRSICQKCYGLDLATENLVDMGEAVGIIAGQSIGEPGTQLTMRTFHTGGIFTSETNQQLITQIDGIVKFSTVLKTSSLRTNRGENVLLTESSGSLSIISNEKKEKTIHIDLPRNTLLFIKNHQYVKKNTLIGQLAGNSKQTKTETKHVLSSVSGEIFMPQLKSKMTSTTGNKLLWILSGQVYQAPMNSFLNFYNDYKINKNSYIFRSKIINQYPGFVHLIKNDNNLFQKVVEIRNNNYSLIDSIIQHLSFPINEKTYILTLKKVKYLVNLQLHGSKLQFNLLKNYNFASLITKSFKTITGGTPYYNHNIIRRKEVYLTKSICFLNNLQKPSHSSIVWLSEETYQINCDNSLLLAENNGFISKNFEIIPDLFSKTAGIVNIFEKKSTIQEISIKSGSFYSISDNVEIKNLDKKFFYPGEILLNKFEITYPSLCEIIKVGSLFKLLVRPIQIYEVPFLEPNKIAFDKNPYINSPFVVNCNTKYIYSSGEKIKTNNQLEIVTKSLDLKFRKFSEKTKSIKFEILLNRKKNCVDFCLSEKLYLNYYIPANLKYTNIQSCSLLNNQQFVDCYTTLGYLEVVTEQSLELVKFKTKRKQNKQIFLISNYDCITFEKSKAKDKTVGDFLIDNVNTNNTGKILIDNNKLLTIQKGRPYFFPNCKNSDFIETTGLKYKFVSSRSQPHKIFMRKLININYYNITIGSPHFLVLSEKYEKFDFPRLLIKKRGKYYTSGIPIFVREFLIKQKNTRTTQLSNLDRAPWFGYLDYKDKIYKTKRKDILSYLNRLRLDNVFIMFMKNSELVYNTLKGNLDSNLEFASVILLEHPFRTIGIHSITEDYFEQEVNNVYCQNGEFIENGQTIGLLNFEKEITGDIVQGLPRVEELLEARKKKRISKHMPKNQKKGLLIRKTTIDPSFEFRKLGTTIKESEKINPHTLLKIYFNYFAKIKSLIYKGNSKIKLCQLTNNYEASYKSFKKVQALILNSVQSVYQSQGVTIADKHLELIIKQMTTKVLISHEGDTPLLPREVIDLYHIKYINQIVETQLKQTAYYVPLLLGITKAALNNPSFISAASFQETTRVLTKAAIEGRLDWLRGLKENIIIGHLIPAGTGSKNYKNSFKNLKSFSTYFLKQNPELKNLENF